MSGWSAAWRLARREVTRHRWRSILVVVLVAFPVMLAVTLGTMLETDDVSPSERLQPELGQAQATVTWFGAPIQQDATGESISSTDDPFDIGRDDIRRRAENLADGPILPVIRASTSLVTERRAWRVETLSTDYSASFTTGMIDLDRGHLPTGPNEIVVSPRIVASGIDVGDEVTVGGSRVQIVGVGDIGLLSRDSRSVAFLPTAPIETDASEWTPEDQYAVDPLSFIVGGSNPVGADDLRAWNRAGFSVLSRYLVEHPDKAGSAVDDFGSDSSEMRQLISIVVVALVIEVILLAGPAFAVGARRQRHELALVSVAGGSPGHVRRIVLLQAAFLGLVAAGVGAAAGIPVAWLAMRVAERFGASNGPIDISWLAVVLAIILAVASATAAAFLPARHSARADVVTTLAGRQPDPVVRPGWPLLGGLLLAIGTLGSIGAARAVSDFANAWWAVVSVLGAVLMTPWLISRVARGARLLPLPARLALRDADRHRARTAPAIAAVMASVSAVTALGIASSSDAAEPDGSSAQIHTSGTVLLTSDRMDAVVPAIRRDTGVVFTPLPTLKDTFVNVSLDSQSSQGEEIAVADAPTLRRWGIDLTGAERDALDSGLLLVDDGVRVSGDRATIEMYDDALLEESTTRRVRATSADLTIGLSDDVMAGAVLHPRSAKQLGLTVVARAAIADRTARDMDINAVEVAAARADPVSWSIDVEKQAQRSGYFWVYVILAAAGSLAVLIGTFSATGLALADARPDLATLGAVGARPLTRRLVAGSHALILATLGAALGVIVGMTPGIVAAHLLTSGSLGGFALDIPWALFALLLLGLPIVAGLITTIVARTPPPRPVREAL